MKVRLKNGEVIKIADYDFVELERCDSYGDPIQVKWDEIETILDDDGYPLGLPKKVAGAIIMPNIDWEKVRIDAAIAMLQGLNANPSIELDIPTTSKLCVEFADALIEELKK